MSNLVIKANNTSRNSNVVSNDDELVVNVEAGSYIIDMKILCSSPSSVGIQMGIGSHSPSKVAMVYHFRIQDSANNDSVYMAPATTGAGAQNVGSFNNNYLAISGSDTPNTIAAYALTGLITTTGGDVALKWAQNTSNAANSAIVYAGSYLRVERIQ